MRLYKATCLSQGGPYKGHAKYNEATQKYRMQGICSAVVCNFIWAIVALIRKNGVEMYQRYMIFGPFCNTFASLFLE